MPEDLRATLHPWAKMMSMWHTGSDYRGERVTGEERRVLRRNIDALERRIMEKLSDGETPITSFGQITYQYRLDIAEVRGELAKDQPSTPENN